MTTDYRAPSADRRGWLVVLILVLVALLHGLHDVLT